MTPPLRILHLEDDPADARLIRDTLMADGLPVSVQVVDNRAAFESALRAGGFDLVLADYKLPNFDGLEALARARAFCPHKPFLFVTGSMGEERAVQSLKSGATDYILKDGLARLAAAIRRSVIESKEHALRKQAEEQLRRTAEELKRSNRDLEQFAYVASHDLKEPLRAISGYVALLQRSLGGELTDQQQKYIQGAAEGAQRMETLIEDLLAFARAGTRQSSPAPADLNELLHRAQAQLHAAFERSEARLIAGPLPTLVVDATQITQVFQNLIANAIKFCDQRPPQIRVAARRHSGQCVISVQDNGIGIAPEHFERIYALFKRLHTRRNYSGTGIGLAICQRIIERHKGTIWVESRPGHGATFFFSLPDHPGPAPEPAEDPARQPSADLARLPVPQR